ncbi:unnamed protein product [Phytomonas sp. Hart1]|nr:unnamed protein product [Phytomonas sp. Hart1]|eukprot:CCW72101.1 unnamed protein product [Phytomonas sp. isolate Hart1]
MSSFSTNTAGGGYCEDSKEESFYDSGPHSAAVELGMHIEDCIGMLPGFLTLVDESLRGIQCYTAFSRATSTGSDEGARKDLLSPPIESFPSVQGFGEVPMVGLGSSKVYERLRALKDPTVMTTLFIRPARHRGEDSNFPASLRSFRVYFNFMEGFSLHPSDEVGESDLSQEETHPTCYESLLSLLLVNFWDEQRKT